MQIQDGENVQELCENVKELYTTIRIMIATRTVLEVYSKLIL